jgi:hypothetical protein
VGVGVRRGEERRGEERRMWIFDDVKGIGVFFEEINVRSRSGVMSMLYRY